MAWRGFGAARAQGADERLLEFDVGMTVDLEPGVGLECHHLELQRPPVREARGQPGVQLVDDASRLEALAQRRPPPRVEICCAFNSEARLVRHGVDERRRVERRQVHGPSSWDGHGLAHEGARPRQQRSGRRVCRAVRSAATATVHISSSSQSSSKSHAAFMDAAPEVVLNLSTAFMRRLE